MVTAELGRMCLRVVQIERPLKWEIENAEAGPCGGHDLFHRFDHGQGYLGGQGREPFGRHGLRYEVTFDLVGVTLVCRT
ncbi:hypothetical protein [Streptomyces europaeiscabiei]|uniref:hypothetical protein n=1 Tax=Streptomyces europaeiscabiei TaxID=146819 RepID=UPI0029B4BC56|nr:hypothetical protein [Streptomyces europaeiscabiei]MDX3586689.1 hypothetical protein [Streptomyces europaeiscabiei]